MYTLNPLLPTTTQCEHFPLISLLKGKSPGLDARCFVMHSVTLHALFCLLKRHSARSPMFPDTVTSCPCGHTTIPLLSARGSWSPEKPDTAIPDILTRTLLFHRGLELGCSIREFFYKGSAPCGSRRLTQSGARLLHGEGGGGLSGRCLCLARGWKR